MILIKCSPSERPEGFLLVAQNPETLNLLGFVPVHPNPYDYDKGHVEFQGCGRYLKGTSKLPGTEELLRLQFFNNYVAEGVRQLKIKRAHEIKSPVAISLSDGETTADRYFDMDDAAQANINAAIESFEAMRLKAVELGWQDDWTLPWTLADNNVFPVTAAMLKAVKDAAASRGLQLHLEYKVKKAELEALLP